MMLPSGRSFLALDNTHARFQSGAMSDPLFTAPSRARSQLGRSARQLPAQRLMSDDSFHDDDASPGGGSQGRADVSFTTMGRPEEPVTTHAQHVRVPHRLSEPNLGVGEAEEVWHEERGV